MLPRPRRPWVRAHARVIIELEDAGAATAQALGTLGLGAHEGVLNPQVVLDGVDLAKKKYYYSRYYGYEHTHYHSAPAAS